MASEIRVVLDAGEMKSLLSGSQGPVFRILNQKANQVKNVAVELAPVDKSKLRDSINYTLKLEGDKPVAYIGTNVFYAIFVHNGTGVDGPLKRAYTIRPKSAAGGYKTSPKALAFTWNGNKIVTRRSVVKGMKPRPFLTDALKRVFGL